MKEMAAARDAFHLRHRGGTFVGFTSHPEGEKRWRGLCQRLVELLGEEP